MPSRHDEGPHNVMKHLKAARPARPKRRPGVAKMVLVPHDKVGAGFMRNVVFPVIAFLGVGSAGYFAIELSQHRQQRFAINAGIVVRSTLRIQQLCQH